MNARAVHGLLAAAVQRPDLIARWRADPGVLLAHGVEPASVDLAALWKFAGMTVKVRHNGVRMLLPQSFRLMAAAGLEIELFAAYASQVAARGGAYPASSGERAAALLAFAECWLDMERTEHVLLWDLMRHEHALAALAADPAPPAPAAERGAPCVRGRLILHELRSDPGAVAARLGGPAPDLSGVELATRYVGYWRADDAGGPRLVELDAFGYHVLGLADGRRSAAELGRLVCGGAPPPAFFRLLGQLADAGLLRLPADWAAA